MSLNRRITWLAVGLLIGLTTAPARSQGLADAQLFAPYAMDEFGGGPRPNEGVFFTFDYMRWTISKPDVTTIGYQGLTRQVYYEPDRWTIQSNTNDTGFLKSDWVDGQRFEFGDVSGHHGWVFGAYRLHEQFQRDVFSGVDMVFQDLEYGDPAQRHLQGYVAHMDGYEGDVAVYTDFEIHDLPVTFDDVTIENRVEHWSAEWMYLYRLHPGNHGGILELYFGARYMEFDEQFMVDARGERFYYDAHDPPTPIGARTVLADSTWTTDAENHIVGPQIGMRYFKTTGRWTFSSEGRFFAGFNSQNIRQRGTLGSKLEDAWPRGDAVYQDLGNTWAAPFPYYNPYVPLTMTQTSFNHEDHEDEFTPAVELRIEAKYQFSRAIAFRVGWDALWMDNIARSSNMIDYTLSETSMMGINMHKNRQDVLMQGWTLGVELNR